MKLLTIRYLYFSLLVFLISCGSSETKSGENRLKKDPASLKKIGLGDCIKSIVAIKNQTDAHKYDSLSTHFFHELEEYVEPEALILSREIDSLKKIIPVDYASEKADYTKVFERIDSLRQELSPFHKFIVGYAFVHTFYDGKDTLSAIFVMDTLCGFGEMTIVKEKLVIDPISNEEYSGKIKKNNPTK